MVKARKRIYLYLLTTNLLIIMILSLIAGYLLRYQEHFVHWVIMPGLLLFLFITITIVLAGVLLFTLNIFQFTYQDRFIILAKKFNSWLLPLVLKMGTLMGLTKEQIKSSFIEVNNQMVTKKNTDCQASSILLLLPHCLQNSRCTRKISLHPDNCSRCGQCQIGELLRIRDESGVKLAIASGGTSAKRFIEKYRPLAVIAVACERDLVAGILECGAIPVYGILNSRPHGPCHDTRVDLKQMQEVLGILTHSEEIPAVGQVLLTD